MFLEYQTGALHILKGFASTRSFSKKLKVKSRKNRHLYSDVPLRTGANNMRFSQELKDAGRA